MTALANIDVGIGAWAWGDALFWGYGAGYKEQDLRAAFEEIAAHGNVLIDTAEIYARGKSEAFIGQFSTQTHRRPPVATKFAPLPWRWHPNKLLGALRGSLHRLNAAQVDLYQMHWSTPPVRIEAWMDAMARAAEEGLTRAIGVSNYNQEQTQRAYDRLARYGLTLAANQLRYSLLDRTIEQNGLLDLCKQLGVRVIAYSPLEQGLLTGKYTPSKPPPGARSLRYRRQLEAIQPLIQTMRELGKAYAEDGVVKTPAQVAINWCICKGTLPIPGAKNIRQARQNIGAASWHLRSEDIAVLDSMSREITRKTESDKQ